MSNEDKNIIAGCIKGRAGDWERFVSRFSGLVMWSIKARLAKFGYSFTDEDAQDIYQEVFLHIYRKNGLSQLKDTSKIAGWLCIVAGNIAVNYIKRVKGHVAARSVSIFDEVAPLEDRSLIIKDTLRLGGPTARDQADEKLRREILAQAIESLSPKEKIILNLHLVYENTVDEIAQALGSPHGSVASIITRAKDKIKQKLKNIA